MERDSLTGLLNHGRFIDRLSDELERCRRTGSEVSLALVDLDDFKRVNDTYGHQRGDNVLRTVAHTFSGWLRRIDIIRRCGGEEFVILFLDTAIEAACTVVDNIRERFSRIQFKTPKGTYSVTFSAGVAGSRNYPTADGLISAADELMYQAKVVGRNRCSEL
jgi:diguanylate cyclase (GGDEF)-like protein